MRTCKHTYQYCCVSKCIIGQIYKTFPSLFKQNTSNMLNDYLGKIPLNLYLVVFILFILIFCCTYIRLNLC